MKKSKTDCLHETHFEVWTSGYINSPSIRIPEDRDVEIVQIEHATADDYIVEIMTKRKG